MLQITKKSQPPTKRILIRPHKAMSLLLIFCLLFLLLPVFSVNAVITSGNAFNSSLGWFSTSYNQRVWPADINGDGKVDLVGIANDATVHYALSNGNGTYGSSVKSSNAPTQFGTSYISTSTRDRVWFADVTGDGRADIIGIDNSGRIQVHLNQGNNTWGSVISSNVSAFLVSDGWLSTSYNQRVWPADINGDGKTDLVGIDTSGSEAGVKPE